MSADTLVGIARFTLAVVLLAVATGAGYVAVLFVARILDVLRRLGP